MNTGPCPYDDCDHTFFVSVPERTPACTKLECEGCKRPVWYKLSRIDPECWTEEEFLRLHDVDEETRRITKKVIKDTQ